MSIHSVADATDHSILIIKTEVQIWKLGPTLNSVKCLISGFQKSDPFVLRALIDQCASRIYYVVRIPYVQNLGEGWWVPCLVVIVLVHYNHPGASYQCNGCEFKSSSCWLHLLSHVGGNLWIGFPYRHYLVSSHQNAVRREIFSSVV